MASILGKLTLLVLSVLIALGGAELAVRLAGIGSDQFLQQDPVLGVHYIPGKRGLSQGSCYRADVTTNSHGWRSGETTWKKPEGVFRIVILGDSFIGALQVNDDQTFSAVSETLLNRSGLARRVEVINLGVPSFGNDQEYLALREFGKRYEPDFVILAIYAQNDVKNNSIVLERRDSAYPKPYFEMRNGELVEVPYRDPTPGWIAFLRRLAQPLRLYPLTRDTLTKILIIHRILYRTGIVGTIPRDEPKARQVSRFPGRWDRQSAVYRRTYDGEWLEAWEITKALLVRTRNEARDIGAGFLLVGIADPIAVLPEFVKREVFPANLRPELDPDKPTAILDEFAASRDIDFFTLVPIFRSHIGQSEDAFTKYYLSCDGHWTVSGNRLAAQAVVQHLIPILKQRIGG
ncbi:MAG: hypothetical protein OER43_01980 [Gammaproteobacteria bacterium]|nr:hypothetical protein [Gammaproteobacteria bacterium]